MYMNRNEVEVTLGRAAEWEATVDEWAGIQSQNAGFMGATLLQSYGNPGRYTLTSRWTDRDASVTAGRREQFVSFARSFLNSGLARPLRLAEAYESVFEVDQQSARPSDSTAERWIDLTLLAPMVAPDFEDRMQRLAEISKQHASGVVSVRLRRSMGKDTRYVLLVITTDRAAARNWLFTPEVRAVMDDQASQTYLSGSPSAEIYHVVKRYAGPAMAGVEAAAASATR